MSKEKQDIELHVHHSTEKAWLVSTDGERDSAEWMPFSVAERGERTSATAPLYDFEVETWWLEKVGFV